MQYANNCLFEPNWEDETQFKYTVVYHNKKKQVALSWRNTEQNTDIYFAEKNKLRLLLEHMKQK